MFISATHPLPELPAETFKYDAVGNRTNVGSYLYDSANRLLEDDRYTYTYDNNGNMVSRTKKATDDVTTYTYNPENQLIRGDFPDEGVVSYRYDGLGRRIEKNLNGTITQYYYDNEDIILETDQDQNILAHYTHGPGIDEPLIMEREGESYYYLADGLGSITTITDSSQNTINSYTYDSFGSIIQSTGSLINPYTYTGREYDPETQLYYYRARYYDPRISRFIQEDPIWFLGGINFYTYCDNNPINWIDPWGLSKEEEDPWWKLVLPDYINLTGNVAIVNPWTHTLIGISGQVIIDRYGRVYVGAGPTVGRAATIVSGSLTGGWILREGRLRRIPTESELSSFLTRHSYNVGGGYIGGGQMTYVPGSGYALEIGGFTPQVGGGYHYTWQKWDKDISW